jgi:hypothetical protein
MATSLELTKPGLFQIGVISSEVCTGVNTKC